MQPCNPVSEEETEAQRQEVALLVSACWGSSACSLSPSPCENPAGPAGYISEGETKAQSSQPATLVLFMPRTCEPGSSPGPGIPFGEMADATIWYFPNFL